MPRYLTPTQLQRLADFNSVPDRAADHSLLVSTLCFLAALATLGYWFW